MTSRTSFAALIAGAVVTLVAFDNTAAQAQFDSILRNAIGAAIQQGLQQQQRPQPSYQPQPYYQPRQLQQQSYGQSLQGPSFNCRGRTNPVELAICNDPELSQLDRAMANAYVSRMREGGVVGDLKAEQAQWRAQRDMCTDRACIKQSMIARTEQLGGAKGGSSFAQGDSVSMPPDSYVPSPNGLELPRLPMLHGVPMVGESPQASVNDRRWFMLLALGLDPGLIDREPVDYASRFLSQQSPLAQSNDWHTSNEFAEGDIRQTFLNQYGSALKRSAIPLPAEIIYTQHVSFTKYDQQRKGFPIESSRSATSLTQQFPHNFDLYGNVQSDVSFWPVKEAVARDLLGRFSVLSRHQVTLATQLHLYISQDDPQKIATKVDHTYLLNPETRQVLYDFGNAADPDKLIINAATGGSPFAPWSHPPKGIQPQRFSMIDGAIAFYDQSVLMQMIAAGGFPDYQTSPNFANQRAGLAHALLTPDEASKIFWQRTNVMVGRDEFEKQRAADRLHTDIGNLVSIAPRPPFEATIVSSGRLHEYERSASGFRIDATKDLGMSDSSGQAAIRLVPSFRWPDFFWPVSAADAERALDNMHGERTVRIAAHISVGALDPGTGRLPITLRSIGLYSPGGSTPLYTFPVHNDESTTTAPAALVFKRQPAFDKILVCAALLSFKSQIATPRATSECTRVIADRDARTYDNEINLNALKPINAEFPFFQRGGLPLNVIDKVGLAAWAQKYVSAAQTAPVRYEHHISQRVANGLSFEAVGHSNSSSGSGISRILAAYHMRPEQVVSYESIDNLPVYIKTPNLAQLYSIVVPFALLNRDTSGGNPVAELDLGSSAIESDDAGQPLLLINVVPRSLTVNANNGNEILSTTFSDVGSLNAGPLGNSDQHPVAALDAEIIDILAANAIGKSMPREALAYLVKRRWVYERNQNGRIDRFFQIGSPQPDGEAAAAQGDAFLNWAAQHAPSLPVNVTTGGPLELTNSDIRIDWGSLPCFASSYALLASDGGRNMADNGLLLSCNRRGDDATEAEKSGCEAAQARMLYRSRVRELDGSCHNTEVRLPFEDPFKAFISLDANFDSLPQITSLGGRQKVVAQVTLRIDSVTGLTRNPRSGVNTEVADYEAHGDAPSSDPMRFVRLNAHVAGISFRDASTQAMLQPRPIPPPSAKALPVSANLPRVDPTPREDSSGSASRGNGH